MRMISSLAATVAAFFVPSRSSHVSIGKLALIGMLVTTFFLFTSAYDFPGGASHYPNWAEAIVHGFKLPATVAQREVGFPLLYILSGFTLTHSFIGLTLILAVFAVLISILVYLSLSKVAPSIAYYTGLACIISLAPFTYMKFFYPDQAYMFFNLLAVILAIRFIQNGNFKLLYFFTLVALAASFTRTAGNLMYPMLLGIAFVMVRGNLRHYLTCILIFAFATGLYQWHRYEIFDMSHQQTKPSGKGMQTFYPVYLYLEDFGLQLSPEIGPNTKLLLSKLREGLGANVRNSKIIRDGLISTPAEFLEKNVYAYTPEKFIEKMITEPNEEYFNVFLAAAGSNDQILLDTAKEIARAHPWYVVKFTMRNLRHALFSPGYATTRYNTLGYIHTRNDFIPAFYGWGMRSEDPVDQYGPRAVKEMQYFPVKSAPSIIQHIFSRTDKYYRHSFNKFVSVTTKLMIIAWLAAFLGLISHFFSQKKFFQTIKNMGIDKLTAPIIAASALILYEDFLTSLCCQPVYRYFHLTEPLRLIVAGFGAIFLIRAAMLFFPVERIGQPIKRTVTKIQNYDLVEGYFSERRKLWYLMLVGLNVVLFTWWVLSTIAHTT